MSKCHHYASAWKKHEKWENVVHLCLLEQIIAICSPMACFSSRVVDEAWARIFKAKNSLPKMATRTIQRTNWDQALVLGSHSYARSSSSVSLTAVKRMGKVDFILGTEPICQSMMPFRRRGKEREIGFRVWEWRNLHSQVSALSTIQV